MDKMIAANGQGVSVPHGDDDVQLRQTQFYTRSKRQRTTMKRVKRMKIHIPGDTRRTSDSGYHDDLVFTEPQGLDGSQHAVQHDAVSASRRTTYGEKIVPGYNF